MGERERKRDDYKKYDLSVLLYNKMSLSFIKRILLHHIFVLLHSHWYAYWRVKVIVKTGNEMKSLPRLAQKRHEGNNISLELDWIYWNNNFQAMLNVRRKLWEYKFIFAGIIKYHLLTQLRGLWTADVHNIIAFQGKWFEINFLTSAMDLRKKEWDKLARCC